MIDRPTVATFPRDDLVFARFVRACLDELPTPVQPAALQRSLRRWHTRATVREQVDIAGFGATPTWYVYRDGRAGVPNEQGWWLGDEVAHVRFGRDGTITAANRAAETLVAQPGGLTGRHWRELVPAAARLESGAWLWQLLDDAGAAQSVFDLPLADGRRRVIEYHMRPLAGAEGYESWLRELAVIEVEPAFEVLELAPRSVPAA